MAVRATGVGLVQHIITKIGYNDQENQVAGEGRKQQHQEKCEQKKCQDYRAAGSVESQQA